VGSFKAAASRTAVFFSSGVSLSMAACRVRIRSVKFIPTMLGDRS